MSWFSVIRKLAGANLVDESPINIWWLVTHHPLSIFLLIGFLLLLRFVYKSAPSVRVGVRLPLGAYLSPPLTVLLSYAFMIGFLIFNYSGEPAGGILFALLLNSGLLQAYHAVWILAAWSSIFLMKKTAPLLLAWLPPRWVLQTSTWSVLLHFLYLWAVPTLLLLPVLVWATSISGQGLLTVSYIFAGASLITTLINFVSGNLLSAVSHHDVQS